MNEIIINLDVVISMFMPVLGLVTSVFVIRKAIRFINRTK